MSAFNVVRFRVKPGREREFINAHRDAAEQGFPGARRITLIKTGDNSYCVVGEWESFDNIVGARPRMISLLDSFRDCLEDLGGKSRRHRSRLWRDGVPGECGGTQSAPQKVGEAQGGISQTRKVACEAEEARKVLGAQTRQKGSRQKIAQKAPRDQSSVIPARAAVCREGRGIHFPNARALFIERCPSLALRARRA